MGVYLPVLLQHLLMQVKAGMAEVIPLLLIQMQVTEKMAMDIKIQVMEAAEEVPEEVNRLLLMI
jgi:hypothetical protein